MRNKIELDIKSMAKKYRFDVSRVIKLWKKDKQDMEIAASLGIDPWKLADLRNEMIKTRMGNRAKKLNWH